METSISPITLSSSISSDTSSATSLVENSQKCDSVITIVSSDFEKMHLSWKGRKTKNSKYSVPRTSVSNIQKVADWIKSIEESNNYNINEKEIESDNDKSNNDQSKGFVIVRCDYTKQINSKTGNSKSLNVVHNSKPLMKQNLRNKVYNNNLSVTKPKRNQYISVAKQNNSFNVTDKRPFVSTTDKESPSSSIKLMEEKSDESSDLCQLPKSIEIRKKELCTYLKLMDPSDKKEILALQNRRSTRVRNLTALQERIKLEKKIGENVVEKSNDRQNEDFNSICLKQNKNELTNIKSDQIKCKTSDISPNTSVVHTENMIGQCSAFEPCNELNIQYLGNENEGNTFDQISPDDSNYMKKSFYFPFPQTNLTSKIQNFDTVMKKLIPKFKTSLTKRSRRKSYSNSTFQNEGLSRNKENIHCVENNVAEKKIEFQNPYEAITVKNLPDKQSKQKINKLKYKNKIDLSSLKNKDDKLSSRNVTNKLQNGKLRSAKFKIRLKKIPSRRDFNKNRRNIKQYLNSRFAKKIKSKKSSFKRELTTTSHKTKVEQDEKDNKEQDERVNKDQEDILVNDSLRESISVSAVEMELETINTPPNDSPRESVSVPAVEMELETINTHPNDSLRESIPVPAVEMELEKINTPPKSENGASIDLQNMLVDINDFNQLTDEHKKCLIESRLFLNSSVSCDKEAQIFQSQEELPPLYGFSASDINEINLMCEMFEQSILKHSQNHVDNVSDVNQPEELIDNCVDSYTMLLVQNGEVCRAENTTDSEAICNIKDHNYTSLDDINNAATIENNDTHSNPDSIEDNSSEKSFVQNRYLEVNPNDVEENNCDILPYDKNVEIKSLQKSLHIVRKKNIITSPEVNVSHEWELDESPRPKPKRLSHYISISKENGDILKAFYVDFNLVVCQEFSVSFWMQTPLGNILGSQDMWIPRGCTQRLVLNNKCVQKDSKEMVYCSETNVVYMELWTKEHKSDIREGPVADIFMTIYFSKQRQNGIDKKVLQLENINGFADDVQYCVMKSVPKIIVSWHVASEENDPRRTFVHAYQLATDYQMVSHILNIEPIDHYVSSLHNIEGSDNLIMGCGEKKITLWNVEYGHKIATIELSHIGPRLSTLWAKCDRGFLFAIQQCGNRELRLIAINGINHSWKTLASYISPEGFDKLKGVCIENGLLFSFYDKGVLCWKAETGEPVDEIIIETDIFTCGNYLIFLEENKIFVRHCTTHLLSISVDEQ